MNSTRFSYPVRLTLEDDRVLVEFPDFPFAATDTPDWSDGGDGGDWFVGADKVKCMAFLDQAQDCLDEAIATCIDEGEPIPVPQTSEAEWMGLVDEDWGRTMIQPGPVIAAKAALYTAVREAGITKVALAALLDVDEKAVRRIMDPRHPTKIQAIDRALAALGMCLEITVREIPAPFKKSA